MSKIVAVVGATGSQGGSVAYGLLKTKQWHVRAVTRNPNSDAAKALAAAGAEMVVADINYETSLVQAFEGVQAIFAVTNFREALMSSSTRDQAGEKEMAQGVSLAKAAARTLSLEQYVWSTLPPASKMTGGKFPSPHLDYKAKVDDYIREQLPELAAKTTFIMMGWYPNNLGNFPHMRPVPLAGGAKYVWPQPCSASTILPIVGDVRVNPGIFVRQILAHPEKTKSRYISVTTEFKTMGEILKAWSEITGKDAVYLNVSVDEYEQMWGVAGVELASQLKMNEAVPDWEVFRKADFLAATDIGVSTEEVVNLKQTLESLSDRLL